MPMGTGGSQDTTQCCTAVRPTTRPVHPQGHWGLNQWASASSRLLLVLAQAEARGRRHSGHSKSITWANCSDEDSMATTPPVSLMPKPAQAPLGGQPIRYEIEK